jgi:hypothetical protein
VHIVFDANQSTIKAIALPTHPPTTQKSQQRSDGASKQAQRSRSEKGVVYTPSPLAMDVLSMMRLFLMKE